MLSVTLAALALSGSALDKKGLQVQMVDDAIALGVRQAALNLTVGDYVRPAQLGQTPIPGTPLALRFPEFEPLARDIEPLRKAGAKVWLILLTRETGDRAIDRVMLHPKYDPACPNKLGAYNVVTAEGQALFRGFSQALARRFPGQIEGIIVGNEVNSHWYWANQGPATAAEVADTTERSLRLVHEGSKLPVYLSLEHHWTSRYLDNPLQTAPGREILETVARLARERGDFGWRLAFHPYPENLFEPRFWLDKTAPLSFDAPRITFKNLEVITEFMKRRELLWRGRPRAVNLTEQGFHRPDSPDGEVVQAAAYAYAWHRVKRNPGIEGFILNRHVDHAHEGGLLLGLWTKRPGSIADPDRKTRMYEVFRACGTADEVAATAFALPIVGLSRWEQARPQPMPNWPKR